MVLVTSGSRLLRMFSATARMTSRPLARSWIKATLPARATWARRCRPSISGGPAGPPSRHLEHQLAEVLAPEELEQGVREGLEALDDVLARPQLAGGHPAGDLARRLGVAVGVIEDQHALHGGALDQQRQVVRRALGRSGAVVLRDGAADDDAGAAGQPGERGVEDVAADVVEVDVQAAGTVLPQRLPD